MLSPNMTQPGYLMLMYTKKFKSTLAEYDPAKSAKMEYIFTFTITEDFKLDLVEYDPKKSARLSGKLPLMFP